MSVRIKISSSSNKEVKDFKCNGTAVKDAAKLVLRTSSGDKSIWNKAKGIAFTVSEVTPTQLKVTFAASISPNLVAADFVLSSNLRMSYISRRTATEYMVYFSVITVVSTNSTISVVRTGINPDPVEFLVPFTYTVVANGGTTNTNQLTFTFGGDVSPNLAVSEIKISSQSGVTWSKGTLTRDSAKVYRLAVSGTATTDIDISQVLLVSITKSGIDPSEKRCTAYMSSLTGTAVRLDDDVYVSPTSYLGVVNGTVTRIALSGSNLPSGFSYRVLNPDTGAVVTNWTNFTPNWTTAVTVASSTSTGPLAQRTVEVRCTSVSPQREWRVSVPYLEPNGLGVMSGRIIFRQL
jgi:hypothetical protein